MSQDSNQFEVMVVKNQKQATILVEKLFTVAKPDAVYSQAVTANDYTVITAAEVSVSMGFGYGSGGGTNPVPIESNSANKTNPQEQENEINNSGSGGGGGGGGLAVGRPVAVISIGPQGVQVEPVIDITKIALALFAMLGSMLIMFTKIRKASK